MNDEEGLREFLIDNKIFVAKYWPNVEKYIEGNNNWEYYFVNNLLPLPIDQRYNLTDMKRIVDLIKG